MYLKEQILAGKSVLKKGQPNVNAVSLKKKEAFIRK